MTNSSSDEVQSSLASITGGASLYVIGQVISRGLGFVLNILLTRGLGAVAYGVYAYSTTLVSFSVIFARVGTGQSLLKFIPKYEDDPARRNFFLGLAYLTAITGSVVAGLGMYFGAPLISLVTLDNPLLVDVLRIFSLVLPFNTLLLLTNEIFRGLERNQYQVATEWVLKPVVRISIVAAALYLGYSLIGIVAGLAVGIVLVCATALILLYTQTSLRPSFSSSRPRSDAFEFYNYSIPLTLKDAGAILYRRVDILMVGFFLAEASVGIYRIAVLLSTVLAMPLVAFNQLFPSVASRLYDTDEMRRLESVFSRVTRWTVTIVIPPSLVAGLYSAELLAVFGSAFSEGALVLVLFTVAQFTNAAVGPSGYLLTMTDHQYVTLFNNWLLGLLNVAFNYLLIVEFGIVGAALATAGVLALVNVLRLAEVWYYLDIHPYSFDFWKPLSAGVVAGLAMLGLPAFLSGFFLLIGGTVVGGVVFFGSLFLFGIEEDDRDFFRNTVLGNVS